MVLTRLLKLSTSILEEFEVDQMPPYLAMSHVWTESLFPVSNLHNKKVSVCDGLKMLQSVRDVDEQLSQIRYCWTDTWCIDQRDPQDKNRQIPIMGEIYKNACAVVVTVRHKFSFTQVDWDGLLQNLQAVSVCARNPITKYSSAAFDLYRSAHISDDLEKAIGILREFNGLAWMKRVWTAQEYILATRLVCIGEDLRPLQLSPSDMNSLLLIHSLKTSDRHNDFANLGILNNIRIRRDDLTLAMELAANREASHLKDEIYGLMAASEVIITPIMNASIDEIWKAWWEQSVRAGHLLWIMLPLSHKEIDRNCVMPTFRYRNRSLANQQIRATPLLGPVGIHEGSVAFHGYFAGACTITANLGIINDGSHLTSELVSKTNGNINFARQICAAISSGNNTIAETERQTQWKCAFHHWEAADRVPRLIDWRYQRLKYRFGNNEALTINECPNGKAFLGLLKNSLKTTPILLFAEDQIPEGRLIAVDINAKLGASDEDERHVFMILSVPPEEENTGRTLHKVGISSVVFVPRDLNIERAKQRNGHIFEGPVERFIVGGSACWYCSSEHKEIPH